MAEVTFTDQNTIEQMIGLYEASKSKRNVDNELGKDAFLQLLITQLQHQNPLEPMDDQSFIAQIAQFSSLEQMQNLNSSFSSSMGYSLLGKYVSAVIADEATGRAKYIEGEVSGVRFDSGQVYLVVNDEDVPLDKVSAVSDKPIGYQSMEIERYNSLIGLLGTVKTVLLEDESPYTLEGIVAKIQKGAHGIYTTLDEVILSVKDIQKDAFESVEEYLEGMKGQQVVFKAKDASTGETVQVEGILRDGIYDEERECYHVILDNVSVPVADIISTRKIDLVSTEQQLMTEILRALRAIEEKIPGLVEEGSEVDEPEETDGDETEAAEELEESGSVGGDGDGDGI